MNWRVSWTTGGESDPTAILDSENYHQIATVNDALDGWQDNANLIEAAPELLAACCTFLDAMRTSGASNGAIRAAVEAAHAAIAKATGEHA